MDTKGPDSGRDSSASTEADAGASPRPSATRLRLEVMAPLAVAGVALAGVCTLILLVGGRTHMEAESREAFERFDRAFDGEVASETALMAATLEALSRDDVLRDVYLGGDRGELLDQAGPIFEVLRDEHRVTHFYFHDPNGVCVLRVHHPPRRGDTIDRWTAREAIRTGRTASGIELGPLGTFTLRVVRPWFDGRRRIGYIELGQEIDHVFGRLHAAIGLDFLVAIDKDLLDRENWRVGRRMLGKEAQWDAHPEYMIADRTLDEVPPGVLDRLGEPHPGGEGPGGRATLGDATYEFQTRALTDAAGRTVGELVALRDVTLEVQDQTEQAVAFVLLCAGVGLAGGGLFYMRLGRIQGRLAEEARRREAAAGALRERVKELDCLYGLAKVVERPGVTLPEIFAETARLLPDGWRYPEIACGRVVFGQDVYAMCDCAHHQAVQTADITLHGERAGRVEVAYREVRPDCDEGPFLAEERCLLDAVAERLGRIAERMRSSELLLRFREALDSSPDSVFLIDRETLRFVDVNETACLVLGYTREELLSLGPEDIKPRLTRADLAEKFDLAIEGGRTVTIQTVHRRKDGSELPVEVHIRAFRTGAGGWTLVGSARDITRHLEADRALRESEARHRLLFESSTDAFILMDVERRAFTNANPAAVDLFGCDSVDELIAHDVLSLSPPTQPDGSDSAELAEEYVRRAVTEGSQFVEWRHRRVDGAEFDATILLTRLNWRGRTLLLGTVRDVTARRELERRLREAKEQAEAASQAKSDFLANMSHEIRTPMTAILGYADLLDAPDLTDDDRVEYVAILRRNGEHLMQLINDILDLSKIEAGKMTVETEPCELIDLVGGVASMMRVPAGNAGIDLAVEYRTAVPERIATDEARLRQALVNLVGNAVKFTDEGQVRIVVSLIRQWGGAGPAVQFDIRDTGCGIEPERLETLFEAFVQGDASKARRHPGTGLGLAITRRIAGLLGGQLSAESTPGEGSTFRLLVPTGELKGIPMVTDPQEAVSGTDNADNRPERSGKSRVLEGVRVLLAEDGRDNQMLIKTLLKRAGAEVEIAENGAAVLERFEGGADGGEGGCALILMDMQMPEVDGYEATRRLRRQGVRLPIIALTAHAMAGDRNVCIEIGCDDYLAKPVRRDKLIDAVRRWSADRHPDTAVA